MYLTRQDFVDFLKTVCLFVCLFILGFCAGCVLSWLI